MCGIDDRFVGDRHVFYPVREWRMFVEMVIFFFGSDVSYPDDSPFAWEDDVQILVQWVLDIEYLEKIKE